MKKIILGGLILISSITGITQANSYIVNIGENMYNTTYGNYTYTYNIDNNLNFKTDDTYNTFFYTYDGGSYAGIRSRMLFWNDNKLYTYGAFQQDMIYGQGYISGFCMSNTTDYTTYCDKFNRNNYNTNINTFYELGAIYDQVYFNADTYTPILCFISNTEDIVSCIHQEISYERNDQNTITPGNLISTIGIKPEQFVNEESKREESPFIGGGNSGITPIIYTGTITNQHAIYAYEQLGLTANQCYGGYPINKLYNTGDVLYQGYQAGTGATIIDLYNTNSGNYQGYNSTYMTLEQTKITQFLNENYEGYQTNGIQFFIGKQEALITIMQQYNNGNQQALNKGKEGYSLFQLYTYCDLLINNNNNNEYTGNTATPDMRRNGINSENHNIITPQTGTVFDQLQDEEGNYTRNKAQDVRDTINRVYSKLTTIFKFRSGVEGIIPQEIIRILLIIILFKIFKK